jgi:hypothetical protein
LDNSSVLFNSSNNNPLLGGAYDKDRPAWYDPIFTKVFIQLKTK